MKYRNCLLEQNFSELHNLPVEKRRNILIALSNFSKFLGKYELFKTLMKQHGMKRQTAKAEDLLISRMTKARESSEILKWIREVKGKFPELDSFMDLVQVSGLRFMEALNSYNLIIDLAKDNRLDDYFIEEREVLQHFRFKEVFLRNTKKVFVSFVPKHLVERLRDSKKLTSFQIRNRLRRGNCGLRFTEIRRYFVTYITRFLTQPEIDFLQGRILASVFMRNYFNPALICDLKTRVFKGIECMEVQM